MRFTSIFHRTGLLLLAVLLVNLLPAHTAQAGPQWSPRSFDTTTPVVIPAAAVRDQLWVTHAIGRTEALQGYELIGFVRILDHMYRQDAALPSDRAALLISQLRDTYNQRVQSERSRYAKTASESILTVFAVLTGPPTSTSPALGAVVAAARDAYHLTLATPFVAAGGPEDRLASAPEMYQASRAADEAQTSILQDALTLARQNRSFGTAFNTLWQATLGVSIYDTTPTLIDRSPTLQALPRVLALMESNGAITTTGAEMKGLVVDYLGQATLVTTEAVSLMQKQNKGEATPETIESRVKELKPLLKEAQGALPIIARIVGYMDPWLGEQVATSGDMMLKVADVALTVVSTIDLLVSATTPLGVIKLVATAAGAIGKAFGLFKEADKPAAPKPEKIILDEIRKLREQVRAMHVEMRTRFDRIDKTLNTMFETIVSRFDQIDLDLAVIDGRLSEIQASLAQIQRDMNRFEKNLQEAISDGFEQDLWFDVDRGLGFRERTGEDMPYLPDFEGYESRFYTWATRLAYNDTYILSAEGPWDDAAAYDRLQAFPPDKALNYLAQFPKERWGLTQLASTALPNPRVWSVTSQAYARLALDWPQHAQTMPLWSSQATTVGRGGEQIQSALRKITTVATADGPRANYPLFEELLDNYRWWSTHPDNQASVGREIQALEMQYLDELKVGDPNTGADDRQVHINLWGGPQQQLAQADLPSLSTIAKCGSGDVPLASPRNIIPSLVPLPFLVGRYLRLGDLEVCYVQEFTDEKTTGYWECIENTKGACRWIWIEECVSTDLWLRIEARFGGQQIAVNNNQLYDDGECHDAGYPARNWSHWKGVFESQFAQASYAHAGPLSEMTARVEGQLAAHQRAVFQKVIDGFGAGPLQVAAKRLSGAKALLTAFVALGLPRALESDEFLRSLLYGNARLLDEDVERRLTALYVTARTTLPTQNIRPDVAGILDQRRESLKTTLWKYLDRIDAAEYTESTRMIETTRDRQSLVAALILTPVVSVTPSATTFGRQVITTAGITRAITVKNSGMAPMTITATSLGGPHAASFTKASRCATKLAAGASCVINVTFRPPATGVRTATLGITSNAPGSPHNVTLSGTGVVPAPANNLLLNAGFELGVSGVPTQPTGWAKHANVTRGDAVKRSGSYALRHSAAAEASYMYSSSLMQDLVPGSAYAFGGWVNIPTPSTADANGFSIRLEVQWRDAANAVVSSTPIRTYTAPTNGTWVRAGAQVVAPARASAATVQMVVSSLRSNIYVDDLFFGNLLANAGFELDVNNDTRPDGWTTNVRVTRSDAFRRSGSYAMRHAATDNASYVVARTVSGLVAGNLYHFDGYVNIPSTSDTFTFRLDVQWRNAANGLISTTLVKSYTAHTGGAWNRANRSLLVPTGATSAQVRMVAESLSATMYVDQLSLNP